jgi:hypothetical protein
MDFDGLGSSRGGVDRQEAEESRWHRRTDKATGRS